MTSIPPTWISAAQGAAGAMLLWSLQKAVEWQRESRRATLARAEAASESERVAALETAKEAAEASFDEKELTWKKIREIIAHQDSRIAVLERQVEVLESRYALEAERRRMAELSAEAAHIAVDEATKERADLRASLAQAQAALRLSEERVARTELEASDLRAHVAAQDALLSELRRRVEELHPVACS